MATKTKAELLQENKVLKTKMEGFRNSTKHLTNRLKQCQDKCEDLEFKVKGFQIALNGMQREGDKLYEQKVSLEEQLIKKQAALNDAEEALEILRAKVAKIQFDEEVVAEHAYQEGYDAASGEFSEAKKVYDELLADSNNRMERLNESMRMMTWIISRLYDLDKFVEAEQEKEDID